MEIRVLGPRLPQIYIYISYWPALRSVLRKTVTEVLVGPRSQFFTMQTYPEPANKMFIFFPAVNWLSGGFVYATLSLNRFMRSLQRPFVKNLTSERASKPDTRQRKTY